MDPFIAELVNDLKNSPAGRLLAQHGFEVVAHDGYANFERKNSDQSTFVLCAQFGRGEGPSHLDEGVELYKRAPGSDCDDPCEEWLFFSVLEFVTDILS